MMKAPDLRHHPLRNLTVLLAHHDDFTRRYMMRSIAHAGGETLGPARSAEELESLFRSGGFAACIVCSCLGAAAGLLRPDPPASQPPIILIQDDASILLPGAGAELALPFAAHQVVDLLVMLIARQSEDDDRPWR